MGALARGQRVHYFLEDPSGYVDSVPAVDHLGRPVINEGEGAGGSRLRRNVTKAERLRLYRITPQALDLPEQNDLYIFASVAEPGIIFTSDRGMGMWSDGVNEDSAFYTSPTVKYRYVRVTPDNQAFPMGRITGFSSGADKAIIAAVAVAAVGYWAYGGAAAGASASAEVIGSVAPEVAGGATASAGAEFVGPMAPEVASGAGGITLADVGKSAAGVAKGAVDVAKGTVAVAGAVNQVSAALNNSGGGNTAPPPAPAPPDDNSIYWMVGGTIVLLGMLT